MEFFRIHKTIPFMHYRHVLNLISLVSFIVAVFWIFTHGLAFSIEFTGGTQMEVRYPSAANTEQVRQDLKAVSNEVLVQTFGTASDIVIRVPTKQGYTSGQVAEEVMKVIHQKTPEAQLTRTEYVGPQVGEELARDGGTALALVVAGIMIYLAFRFEWKFSVAAIIANLHDIFIVLGIFSVMQWEFSLPVLAAVLAVLGYSVNESVIIFDRVRANLHDIFIVLGIFSVMQWEFSLPVLAAVLAVLGYSVNESVIIFDRVREHFRTMRRADTMEVINSAITATISRTVITHTSTLCMTLSMFFFGGPALHYFSLALTIGILLGVYSSVFVAAAIALYLGVKREDLVRPVKKDEVEEMVP